MAQLQSFVSRLQSLATMTHQSPHPLGDAAPTTDQVGLAMAAIAGGGR